MDPAVPVSSDRFVNLLADYPDWEKIRSPFSASSFESNAKSNSV